MRLGIVLAAGEATRNPNKLLLPMPHMGQEIGQNLAPPAVCAAVSFVLRAGASNGAVVLREGGAVDLYDKVMQQANKSVAYQTGQGVVDAICCGLRALDSGGVDGALAKCDDVLVCFGDNAYDVREAQEVKLLGCGHGGAVASIRDLPNSEHLDYWNANLGRWHSREMYKYPDESCFAGWLLLGRDVAKSMLNSPAQYAPNMPALLNYLKVQPLQMDSKYLWHDVGTPEGYLAYLQDVIARKGAE